LNRWGNNVSTLKFPYLWDGNDEQGNRVTQGVYYYLTKKKNSCKNKKEQAGMIHVIY
jgi:flagellar hook assembly protein FlgD